MWKEHTNSKTQVCVWRHRRIHGLSCSKSAGRISRHRGLNAIILRALTAIHMHPTLEPVGISRNNGKRPDGATMGAWSKGQKLLWLNPMLTVHRRKEEQQLKLHVRKSTTNIPTSLTTISKHSQLKRMAHSARK
uniref:Uncharacterized protein n=1 Tax=Cacopsylla melanoneura TaxID=428564 RepID=A0A8D8YZR9_9HEMI